LLKNLDKFFNRKDLPWVKLVWENTIVMADYQVAQKMAPSGGGTF
jgi:hypothetical protein